MNGIALYYRLPMVQVNDEQSFIEQAEWSMLVQLFNQRLQERIQSGELKTISGGTARSVKIAPDYQSLFFRVNARDDNMQDAANALMAELAKPLISMVFLLKNSMMSNLPRLTPAEKMRLISKLNVIYVC